MNKLTNAFENGKAVMAFLTCGDPDTDTTLQIIHQAVANGADIIELNIPFSDPTAMDPVIQEANLRSLAGGTTTDKVFDFLRQLRRESQVPVVISSYANVVLSYGIERFVQCCAETGVDGILIPDAPFEEREEFLPLCKEYGVALILMVAVTSRQRVAAIAREAEGLLYIMACPGTREQELCELTAQLRASTDVPCVICLNGTEDARFTAVAAKVDGVAVDAPLAELSTRYGKDAPKHIGAYIRELKTALGAN